MNQKEVRIFCQEKWKDLEGVGRYISVVSGHLPISGSDSIPILDADTRQIAELKSHLEAFLETKEAWRGDGKEEAFVEGAKGILDDVKRMEKLPEKLSKDVFDFLKAHPGNSDGSSYVSTLRTIAADLVPLRLSAILKELEIVLEAAIEGGKTALVAEEYLQAFYPNIPEERGPGYPASFSEEEEWERRREEAAREARIRPEPMKEATSIVYAPPEFFGLKRKWKG